MPMAAFSNVLLNCRSLWRNASSARLLISHVLRASATPLTRFCSLGNYEGPFLGIGNPQVPEEDLAPRR